MSRISYVYTNTPWVIVGDWEDLGVSEEEDEDANHSTSSLISPAPTTIAPPRYVRKRPPHSTQAIAPKTSTLTTPSSWINNFETENLNKLHQDVRQSHLEVVGNQDRIREAYGNYENISPKLVVIDLADESDPGLIILEDLLNSEVE